MPKDGLLPKDFDLSTDSFEDFCALSEDFFSGLDRGEVADAAGRLTADDFEWHPGGFLVARSFGGKLHDERGGLRLHLWPSEIDRSETDIHAHPWHLAAQVLAGQYFETLPSVIDSTEGIGNTYKKVSSHISSTDPLELTQLDEGLVEVYAGNANYYDAGEIHVIEAGEYHHTPISNEKMVVTLALIGPQLYDSGYFLRPVDHVVGQVEPPRESLTDQELVDEASRLIEGYAAI